jgi:hypothetical protein
LYLTNHSAFDTFVWHNLHLPREHHSSTLPPAPLTGVPAQPLQLYDPVTMGGWKGPKIKIKNPIQQIKDLQWKDLDPTNKSGALAGNLRELDKQVLQPLEQAALTAAFVSIPYAGPLAAAYFATLFQTSGPHQALPMWLKIVLEDLDLFPHLDLTKVAYHER